MNRLAELVYDVRTPIPDCRHHSTQSEWVGWILCEPADRTFLETLGVVGDYSRGIFNNCRIPHDVFEKLDPHWGRFVWSLEQVAR